MFLAIRRSEGRQPDMKKKKNREGFTVNSQESLNVITPIGEYGHSSTLVLLLPGLSGNVSQWGQVIPQVKDMPVDLAHGAPILPHPAFGHGKPTVTTLARLMAEELRGGKWKEIVIVAHSVGAFVALGVARRLPDTVKEVILINGGLTSVAKFLDKPIRELMVRPRTCLNAIRLFALVSTPTPPALREAIVKNERSSRVVLGGLVSDAVLESEEQRRALMDSPGTPEVLRALWNNRHHWNEFKAYASEIKPKVLFLAGGQDPMSRDPDTQAMAALLPNAEIRVLPGIGHAAPLETAEPVVEAIRDAVGEPVSGALRRSMTMDGVAS
jgi:pimeloyl-ACP methyl ester carboxylesterase